MERTSLRSLLVTVVAMGLFVYLPLGMFAQDARAIESQEFRKMAKKTADLEPWTWGSLFNDAVSEPDSSLQLGKMIELLKYSGGRDYACAHALELVKRIQHEPARHEVMNLFLYAQGDLPNDTDILRTLTRHNRIRVGEAGLFPCAGVYAVVVTPGMVRAGDGVGLN